MSDKNVRINQEPWDDALRVKSTGVRVGVAICLLLIIAMNTCSTEMHTRMNTRLLKEQYDLARRQYALDSLRFEQSQHRR